VAFANDLLHIAHWLTEQDPLLPHLGERRLERASIAKPATAAQSRNDERDERRRRLPPQPWI
jgi:hypothetical protein